MHFDAEDFVDLNESQPAMLAATELRLLLEKIARDNDLPAYKVIFLHYHNPLLRFSHSILHCRQSAEEVVSDIFLKLWIRRLTLPAIKSFPVYLYAMTKNLSINRLLKDRKEAFYSLDEIQTDLRIFPDDPEMLLISRELYRRIQAAMDTLPPRCRLIFRLVKEDGLRYSEVAGLLQLSTKTIEAQMTIALRRMGEAIWQHSSTLALN